MTDNVDDVRTIDDLIAKTAKVGDTVVRISDDVAIRFHERAGWHVMDVLTLTKKLKNDEGNEVVGIRVEAPLGEQQLNHLIQVMQARRLRR